jgi:uncharacterized protein
MIILDANILLYAYDDKAAEHERVRRWLVRQFDAREAIGLPWVSICAFLRIATNPRINRTPLSLEEAFAIVREIQTIPRATLVQPGPQHGDILEGLAIAAQAAGPRMTDATLAAIAIELGAKLASTDRDFARFQGLHWINPLD